MAWAFWAEALLIPCFAMFLNLALRSKARIPATGAADLLMLLVIFDAISLFQLHVIEHLVSEAYRPQVIEIFVVLLFGGITVWALTIIAVEPLIERGFDRRSGRYSSFPLFSFMLAWTVAVALTVSHAMIFLWD